MIEACFCGRAGPLTDRDPVYCGDLVWGLRCRDCGDVDRLEWLHAEGRDALLREASPVPCHAFRGQAPQPSRER